MSNTVTQEQINKIIEQSEVDITTHGGKTTIVVATLPNGFKIVESSSCVDPVNYDEKMGAQICLQRIANKIWELEGYVLQKKVAEANTNNGVTLKELYHLFKTGTPIKRKSWGGYWIFKDGKVEIHTKEGIMLDFLETEDIIFTLSHVFENDWEVATN